MTLPEAVEKAVDNLTDSVEMSRSFGHSGSVEELIDAVDTIVDRTASLCHVKPEALPGLIEWAGREHTVMGLSPTEAATLRALLAWAGSAL